MLIDARAPGKVPKNTFGRQPVHGTVGQISAVLVAVCALQKKHKIRDHKWSTRETRGLAKMEHQQVQSETTNGAPERPEVLPKWSTSKSNQRTQTKHQKVQSETTNGVPERPEVLPKWSTSKSNQRAQTKHQKVQSETTNGAPERPEVLPKWSTSKRAQTKHQQVQSETTNGAPANLIRDASSTLFKSSLTDHNQRPQTDHQEIQSETRIREHKRSTRK